MARIVIALELGNGYGHLLRALPLALALRERGHELMFIANDVARAEAVLAADGFEVHQAPLWLARVGGLPPVRSYTDILLRFGFLDASGLQGVARAWRHLLRLLAPQLLLLDHAPVALFASRGLGLPRLRFGDGFTCPPLASPMPPLAWWERPDEAARQAMLTSEVSAIRVANQASRKLALAEAPHVAALLQAEGELLCTWPELDHYAQRAAATHLGPLLHAAPVATAARPARGAAPAWPAGEGPRVLVYVRSEFPFVDALVAALQRAGARALLHVPGLAPAHAARIAGASCVFSAAPLDFARLAGDADLAVTHGGYGSTHELLLHGVPLLLLPSQAEQMMQARRVVQLGAAITPPYAAGAPNFDAALMRALKPAAGQASLRDAARRFAAAHADFDAEQSLAVLVQRCASML